MNNIVKAFEFYSMNSKTKFVVLSFFFLTFCACNSEQDNRISSNKILTDSSEKQDTFLQNKDRSEFYQNIPTDSIPAITYSIYIPKPNPKIQKYSLLMVFDPQANSSKVLEKYKQLADKYHYIFVGSNHSRNGLPWQSIQESSTIILKEVLKKYPINTQRIYTMGFSGGARVAAELAIEKSLIRGVIAIGAGFQNTKANLSYNFDFFGMAAMGDFNYTELQDLDQMLSTTSMNYYIHFYNGTHEWPSLPELEQAFIWLEFQGMKANYIPKNDSLINHFCANNKLQYQIALKNKATIEAYDLLKKDLAFSKGLTDQAEQKKAFETLANSDAVRKYKKQTLQLKNEELELTQKYWRLLSEYPIKWWKAEILKIKNASKIDPNSPKTQMKNRVLGFLGLAVFSKATNAVARIEEAQARKLLAIYQLLEPNNPEHEYLLAKLEVQLQNETQSKIHLEQAVKLGFKDKNRLLNEPCFKVMLQQQDFLKIIATL